MKRKVKFKGCPRGHLRREKDEKVGRKKRGTWPTSNRRVKTGTFKKKEGNPTGGNQKKMSIRHSIKSETGKKLEGKGATRDSSINDRLK